ncbi:MAG: three-Cys-motif partner protein TcmP [Clostridia bacterium]|nr:three-Cys-motif partner protein TcmP [Clostridia bacterium]
MNLHKPSKLAKTKKFFQQKESQTITKHIILESYLRPWAMIARKYFPTACYIDGFAGPGRYDTGEECSPVIAARILQEESGANMSFCCFNVELDKELYYRLEKETDEFRKNMVIINYHGSFDVRIREILAEINKINRCLAFFFIDPFGYADANYSHFEMIAQNEKTEVLLNFAYDSIQHWSTQTPEAVTALFGTDEWQSIMFNGLRKEKEKKLLDLLRNK